MDCNHKILLNHSEVKPRESTRLGLRDGARLERRWVKCARRGLRANSSSALHHCSLASASGMGPSLERRWVMRARRGWRTTFIKFYIICSPPLLVWAPG